MRRFIITGLIVLSSSLWARSPIQNPNCTAPVYDAVIDRGGKVYAFGVEQSCTVHAPHASFEEMKNHFMDTLKTRGEVLSETNDAHLENLSGSLVDYQEGEQDTGHGTIKVRSNVYLVKNDVRLLLASFSTEISGTSYAANTKKVDVTINYTTAEDGTLNLSVKEVLDLKKPTLAPRKMFENEAFKGVTEAVLKIVSEQLSAAH